LKPAGKLVIQTEERGIALKKIKTKKFRVVNGKSLIVTADMGKDKHYGYWRCPDGTDVKSFPFSNNGSGFHEFWQRISRAKEIHNLDEIVFGYESTGSYAEALVHFMRARGVRLVQVNPMHTKRVKELQGNSPNKTDQKDPKVIADIIELGHALSVVIPEGPAAELRRLTQARERSTQRHTALVNQLQGLIAIIFPEFLQVMKDVKTATAKHLLKHCPTPKEIVAQFGNLTQTIRKVSRGKLGADRAQALYEAAESSVGVTEGQAGILREIRAILAAMEVSEQFNSELEAEMVLQLQQIPYSNSILSFKGIGEVTAAGLIGEVGDFRKFSTLGEIMKLAGFDLFEISSGKHRGTRRISKRGRPLLRKLLYFAALNTVRKGGVMHQQYQRYLDRGMIKTKALIAVARKLLGIIFAVVRDHSVYEEDYIKKSLELKAA
jgi:transposase